MVSAILISVDAGGRFIARGVRVGDVLEQLQHFLLCRLMSELLQTTLTLLRKNANLTAIFRLVDGLDRWLLNA